MPTVLGVLNLSADSFSDGGEVTSVEEAVARARVLIAGGADLVDVGAVSSHPDAAGLAPDAEIARLSEVLEALDEAEIPTSVDSFAPDVQRWAAPRVAVLNDIRGFPDPSVWPVLAGASCTLIVMHALQDGRADRRPSDPSAVVERMLGFFDARLADLERAGIERDRLVVDPGMGFFLGANPLASVEALRAIPRLRDATGCPVLVGVSRKSFLSTLLGGRAVDERGPATLGAELWAVRHGADWVRTHDPGALTDALGIQRILDGEPEP